MSTTSGSPRLTASAIVAPVVGSWSHILRVDGYSGTKGLGNGRGIASETFAAGGYRWRLQYYPDSSTSEDSDWISIALNLVDYGVDKVEASFTISLLDAYGDPVPSYCRSNRHAFQSFRLLLLRDLELQKDRRGVNLIERRDLEESVYLKDDSFSVRCDVTVVAREIFTKVIPVSEVLHGVVKQER